MVDGVLTKPTGAANFDVSETGSLVYFPGVSGASGTRRLVLVDREGEVDILPAPPAGYDSPRFSPDGRFIALELEGTNTDVIVYDIERDTPTRLTFEDGRDGFPVWTPDGQRIVFSSDRDGDLDLFSKAADGTGPVELVHDSAGEQTAQAWSADGESLVVQHWMGGANTSDISVLGVSDGDSERDPVVATEFAEFYADVSPDGRWLAYTSLESGSFEIYARPFPNVEDGRWQISRAGGRGPIWGPESNELFYRMGTDMMVVTMETEPTLAPGNPRVLFSGSYRPGIAGRARAWDLSPDGQQFLMIQNATTASGTTEDLRLILVQDWFQELRERLPLQ